MEEHPTGETVMTPVAIITPLKAIRMLLDGTGVLVRAERWEEVNRGMTADHQNIDEIRLAYASHADMQWLLREYDYLEQAVQHWKDMYEQANQQRGNWYERCQAAERQLAQTIDEYNRLAESVRG